jgi:hypothetical protein
MLSKDFFAVFPLLPLIFDLFSAYGLIDQSIAGTSLVRGTLPKTACPLPNAVSTRC